MQAGERRGGDLGNGPRPGVRRRWFAAAAALLAWGVAAPARAEPGGLVAEVVIAAAPADAVRLELALNEPLDRLGVRVRWMRVEWFELSEVVTPDDDAPAADVRAWFDLVGISAREGSAPAATVYLADAAWERVLVRSVPFEAGLDELAREELATIVLSAVEGLLSGQAVGRSREQVREELGLELRDAPPSEVPPAAPVPPVLVATVERTFAERWRLEPAVAYRPGGLAREGGATHGLVLGIGLTERTGFARWGAWLSGGYRVPFAAEGAEGVGVRLDVGVLRASAAVELAFSDTLALQLALGGGIDVVRAEPRAEAGLGVELESAATFVEGVLEALVAVRIVLSPTMSLWLGVGVEVDPAAAPYVVRRSGVSSVVLDPWFARPFGSVGLSFDVLDPGD